MDTKDVEICFGDDDPCEVQRIFEEPAELTFPSQQYGSVSAESFAQSEPRSQGYHDDRCRIATLDVRHYRPEEISLKVEGGKILIHGKHYSERAFGFDSSEFRRNYDLPLDCDSGSVSSRISRDGVLKIEASNRRSRGRQAAATNFCTSEKELSDDKNFIVALDMGSFAPEEVSIEVVGNGLRVSAKHESRTDGRYSSQQFSRQFVLPSDVDTNTVISSWSNDGELRIRAERKAPTVNKARETRTKEEEYSGI